MIDTHCHLDLPAFAEDVDAVVGRATAAGVIGMLVPAVRPATWAACAALVERHAAAGLRLAIGVHPQIVPELAPDEIGGASESTRAGDGTGIASERPRDGDIDAIAAWVAREAIAYRAVAIGECGLDGGTNDMPRQEALFRAHIRAARITGLPLVIHVLRAHDRAPRILREELDRASRIVHELDRTLRVPRDSMPTVGASSTAAAGTSMSTVGASSTPTAGTSMSTVGASSTPTAGTSMSTVGASSMPVIGVLHSYSGGAALVDVYRELGMAFSFAGPVSYANARKPVEAARLVPEDLLLAETDAPDQAPQGHRGGRSEPAFVGAVIAGLAAARGVTAETIGALTTANAQRIFGAWPSSTTTRE